MALPPEQYLKPEVIQQVERLDLRAKFIVEGFLSGLHRSPFHGFSVEFSEHRKYTPGDDPRLIDWNAYGKTDRYYIKKYQAETNLEAYLLIDGSASMGYSTDHRMSKLDYSICLAAALGHLCIRQQDPLGLFVFDEKINQALPPKAKRSHLTNILRVLSAVKPLARTQLADCLHRIAERVRKRSLLILLSDLLDDPPDVIESLEHLRYRGHDLVVLQVLEYAERTLDFDTPAEFVDPETDRRLQADPRVLRPTYRRRLEEFIDHYRTACQAVNADFVTVDNAMTFDTALLEFLRQRQGSP